MVKRREAVEQVLLWAREEADNPLRFITLKDDPLKFAREVLGVTTLWEKQIEILEMAKSEPHLAIRSGHSIGKTFVVAILILWWLYARQGMVITTAPTWEHVEGVLWREINSLANGAKVKLPCVQEGLLTQRSITETWYATGLSTNRPSAFQGRHHPRLLVVIDEAAGVPEQVHLEVGVCATDPQGPGQPGNCVVMIGNPTSTSGTFYDAFAKDTKWKRMRISCLDHPNVKTGEKIIPGAVSAQWVEEKRQEWGENHPFWFSRVLGEFPRFSSRGVIPLAWVERAQNEEKRQEALKQAEQEKIPRIGGLDVARYGENACVLWVRRGDAIEHMETWSHASLMETAGKAKLALDNRSLKALVGEAAGLGGGVVDRLLEQRLPVFAYNGGHRAFTPSSFSNRRTELWWGLRSRFEHQRLWLPSDVGKLVGDLIAPEYQVTSSGRIQVETKEQLLKRGIKSPDYADALVECFAIDENPEAFLSPLPSRGVDTDVAQTELIASGGADSFGFGHGF